MCIRDRISAVSGDVIQKISKPHNRRSRIIRKNLPQRKLRRFSWVPSMSVTSLALARAMACLLYTSSPTYHKYDISDYENIDEQYGTIDDFKQLIEACHKRGIRVIIDFPINHTSSKHPWFTQAVEYLEGLSDGQQPDSSVCPYVDYYNFTTDQLSSVYYKAGSSNWYYEGKFWSEMPDLNLDCEAVKMCIRDRSSWRAKPTRNPPE